MGDMEFLGGGKKKKSHPATFHPHAAPRPHFEYQIKQEITRPATGIRSLSARIDAPLDCNRNSS